MTNSINETSKSQKLTPNQQAVLDKLSKSIKRVNGVPKEVTDTTVDNFLTIFREDENFASLCYNVMSGRPMVVTDEEKREWDASDDAWSRGYIEKVYGIYNQGKWEDALLRIQKEREFNPAQDLISKVEWDGQPHCEGFLIKWMGAEDCEYSREVSRLLFAGGINRLYSPGCKYDCVPVLTGAQGSGKSTLCHWLALEDDLYSSINTIEGQKGSEGIQGVWVCEIEELLAVLANDKAGSASEEKAKAFISKQDEYYRQPYTKRPEHHPRQCIFIGTTNRETFLSDKTGNRRWFPIHVDSVASNLYDHEDECKADILQAWAEMKAAYDEKKPLASAVPSEALMETIKAKQEEAADDDWRIGIIEQYLRDKTSVCLAQVWFECVCRFTGAGGKLNQKTSRELANILVHQLGWERGGTAKFDTYNKQKAFYRPQKQEERTIA